MFFSTFFNFQLKKEKEKQHIWQEGEQNIRAFLSWKCILIWACNVQSKAGEMASTALGTSPKISYINVYIIYSFTFITEHATLNGNHPDIENRKPFTKQSLIALDSVYIYFKLYFYRLFIIAF